MLTSGMKASSNSTSLNSCRPGRLMIGRVEMPGVFMSTTNCVRPKRRFSLVGGEVRNSPIMCVARCALLVQILRAVDQPAAHVAALGGGRLDRGGEDVGAAVGLGEADGEARLAADDLRDDLAPHLLLAVAEDHRPRLPVGDPVEGDRRAVRQHLLDHHVALKMRAPVPAIRLREGQADPAALGDLAAELRRPGALAAGAERRECSLGDLLAQEGAHLEPQRLASGGSSTGSKRKLTGMAGRSVGGGGRDPGAVARPVRRRQAVRREAGPRPPPRLRGGGRPQRPAQLPGRRSAWP